MSLVVFTFNNKQYLGSLGEFVEIDKIAGAVGEKLNAQSIQLVSDNDKVQVGEPNLPQAIVKLEIVEQGRKAKQHGLKYKAKKNYRRHWGFRREYTKVKILEAVTTA